MACQTFYNDISTCLMISTPTVTYNTPISVVCILHCHKDYNLYFLVMISKGVHAGMILRDSFSATVTCLINFKFIR